MSPREREVRRCATDLLAHVSVSRIPVDPVWIARRPCSMPFASDCRLPSSRHFCTRSINVIRTLPPRQDSGLDSRTLAKGASAGNSFASCDLWEPMRSTTRSTPPSPGVQDDDQTHR